MILCLGSFAYFSGVWFYYFAAAWISLGIWANLPFFVNWTRYHIVRLEKRYDHIFIEYLKYNNVIRKELALSEITTTLKRGRSRGVLLELWIESPENGKIKVTSQGGFDRVTLPQVAVILFRIQGRDPTIEEQKLIDGPTDIKGDILSIFKRK